MGLIKKKRCKHCKRLFFPDHRNRSRQKYCDRPECRQASKTASQKKWLSKPENQDHFRGHVNVERVREWRKANPGYWRRKRKKPDHALQEPLELQPAESNINNGHFTNTALQDFLTLQPAVFIGLISQITGSALQDDIETTLRHMQQLGQDVLSCQINPKGGNYDCKACHFTGPVAESP